MPVKPKHPQEVQNAIAALKNAHTDIHRAIAAMEAGDVRGGLRIALLVPGKISTALFALL